MMIDFDPLTVLEQDSARFLLKTAYDLKDDPKQALELAQQALNADISLSGQALFLIGQTHYQHARFSEALTALESACTYLEQENNLSLASEALLSIGRIKRDQGHFEIAAEFFSQSLEIAEKSHTVSLQVNAMNLLASVYDAQGQTGTALKYLKESLILAEQSLHIEQQAIILNNMGSLYHSLGYEFCLDEQHTDYLVGHVILKAKS